MYILKRTRLTPKMTTANCHVICKQESFKWPEGFPLCEDTPILFIIIHDGIKHVVVNRKSELYGLRIDRFFVSAHKLREIYLRWTLPKIEDLYCKNELNEGRIDIAVSHMVLSYIILKSRNTKLYINFHIVDRY